ncbi:MAG: hypothetical protein HY016_00055 [Nitrosomonadales bacterium]|nr:hypothetical protein [Nitrosomonadales bacterium]
MSILTGKRVVCPAILLAVFLVAACNQNDNISPTTQEQLIEAIDKATVNPIKLQGELSDMFAFGSKYTDLQRENMLGNIVGNVIQWELPVYEVTLSGDVYKVQTKGSMRVGDVGTDLIPATIYITPRSDSDRRLMETLKTDDMISFKGVVSTIILRSYIVVEPAILINNDNH